MAACPACTFVNSKPNWNFCEICISPNPAKPQAAAQVQNPPSAAGELCAICSVCSVPNPFGVSQCNFCSAPVTGITFFFYLVVVMAPYPPPQIQIATQTTLLLIGMHGLSWRKHWRKHGWKKEEKNRRKNRSTKRKKRPGKRF